MRRPAAHRPGRRAFVSVKKKQNTCKATVISDGDGRLLWQGAFRPGRMPDVTALRTEGIEQLLRPHPEVKATHRPGRHRRGLQHPPLAWRHRTGSPRPYFTRRGNCWQLNQRKYVRPETLPRLRLGARFILDVWAVT